MGNALLLALLLAQVQALVRGLVRVRARLLVQALPLLPLLSLPQTPQ